jgi:hypothetical protein
LNEIPVWSEHFERRLYRWLLHPRGHGRPKCPDCSKKVQEINSTVGQPVRILFACGHQFQSPIAGMRKVEIQ